MDITKIFILAIVLVIVLMVVIFMSQYLKSDKIDVKTSTIAKPGKITFFDTNWSNGYVGLLLNTPAPFIKVGDEIVIDKTVKTLNPQYDGKHKVTAIENEKKIITDIPWGQNSNNEGGTIYL